MTRCIYALLAALVMGVIPISAQNAPAINFDSAANPLTLPDDIYLGEVGGVATNSRGDIFVYTRTGHPTVSMATARPFVHGGSFHAPDQAFADAYAREFYARRQESVALWVVPREAIVEIDEFPDEFDLKYRRVDGYSIKTRLKEAREQAGTAAAATAE